MKKTYPHLNAPSGGYVFVVTYGRSGSTLLQNLLNSIPGYCIRGENAGTLSHLARAWQMVDDEEAMRGARASGVATDTTHPWYGAELMRPAVYGRALADVFAREILHLPKGVKVAGFKEIRYHIQPWLFRPSLQFLRAFFPQARFIFNTRNHDAVAKSGWWAEIPKATVLAKLVEAETLFDAWIANHPSRCLKLHYDDYVGQPEALRPLFDFLREPFDAAQVASVLDQRLTHLHPPAG